LIESQAYMSKFIQLELITGSINTLSETHNWTIPCQWLC